MVFVELVFVIILSAKGAGIDRLDRSYFVVGNRIF
jgi:hypothetical protein